MMLGRGIPPRPAGASPLHVDLTRHYTLSLLEMLHRAKNLTDQQEGWFAKLPTGLVTLAGVTFDVRGIVHLNGGGLAAGDGTDDQVLFVPLGMADNPRSWEMSTLGKPLLAPSRTVRVV